MSEYGPEQWKTEQREELVVFRGGMTQSAGGIQKPKRRSSMEKDAGQLGAVLQDLPVSEPEAAWASVSW